VFLSIGLALLLPRAALAVDVGSAVVKAVTVGAVVSAVSGPADKAINTLTANQKLPPGVATKVVPVISLGEKGYVGAAQVAGAKARVDKTKSVIQFETAFNDKQYRIKLLMPMDSVNPLQMDRVKGMGVSALVDTALSSNAYLLPPSERFNAGDAVKAAAIALAVNQYGPQINDFINSTFKSQGGTPDGATKVVPYLSFGTKAYIGMMQVAGPKAQVDKVKAVWQFEQLFDKGRVRLRALVPSNSVNPLKLARVKGVGCTAIVDAMALRAKEYERNRAHYRYFDHAGIFIGLGEDPHWRPPGWDRGRKTGWAKHGDPTQPPGQAKRGDRSGAVIVIGDDDDKGDKHRERAREREQRRRGRGRDR